MSGTSVRSIGMLGLVGLVGLMIMMLMSLSSMTDSGAVGLSREVHKSLARSLDEDVRTTRVTMLREGGRVDGPRHYTVSLQPSAAVATDERACTMLLARAAEFVGTRVGGPKSDEVAITCVAVRPGAGDLSREFVRTSGDDGISVRPRETASAPPPSPPGAGSADAPSPAPGASKTLSSPKAPGERETPAKSPTRQPTQPGADDAR